MAYEYIMSSTYKVNSMVYGKATRHPSFTGLVYREDIHKTMVFPINFLGIADDCWFVINPIPWFSIESSHVEGPYGGIS